MYNEQWIGQGFDDIVALLNLAEYLVRGDV